jgi:hypothetical protein
VAAADSVAAGLDALLAARPPVLYQVFGGRGDPRMLPVAALVDGGIRPLRLSGAAWQRFDSLYHRPGAVYTVYQDGRPAGSARVTRPMWDERGEPLYELPHCRQPTPLAAVHLKAPPPIGFFVEHLATNARVERAPRVRAARLGRRADVVAEGRRVAAQAAEAAGVEAAALERLDFRVTAVDVGAGAEPTLVVSFVDPAATATAPGGATHLFVLADRGADGYVPTYARLVRGGDGSARYRRYVDHLDLTGDGVDELVLEGWSSGRESFLLILQRQNGRWAEVFQGSASWCLS